MFSQQTSVSQQPAPGVDPQTWLEYARYYASLGLPVMPLVGKKPLTPNGFKDASLDPNVWLEWLQRFGPCNIGIAMPLGKVAIDVDLRNDGERQLEALEQRFGERFDLNTFTQRTNGVGGGGWHFIYDAPPDLKYPADKLEGEGGIDVKQQWLGYLVAAPSLHPDTGLRYELAHNTPRFAQLPAWMRARLVPRGESRAKPIAPDEIDDVRRDAAGWGLDPDLVVQDVSPEAIRQAVEAVAPIYTDGQRHAVRVALGSMLARRGWSAASVEECISELAHATGGDTSPKVVRECLAGMTYPGGYHKLAGLCDAKTLEAIDAAIANPYGSHLKESRAAAANDVMARLAKIEAQRALTASQVNALENDPAGEDFFGWLAPEDPGPAPLQLVAGLDITDGRTTGLAGLPHAGKTPLAMSLALSIANGKPWLGRETQQRPVLYLNFEKGFDAVHKRKRLAVGLGVTPGSLDLLNLGDKGAFLNDKADSLAKVVASVKRVHARTGQAPLLMIDTLANSVAGVDHNVASYAEPLRELVVAARQLAPCSVVVLLHCRKSLAANTRPTLNDVEGSGQIVGLCDAVIGLHKPDAGDGNKVTVSGIRTLTEELPPIEIEWAGGKDEPLTCSEVGADEAREATQRAAARKGKTLKQYTDEAYDLLLNAIQAAPEGKGWTRGELKAIGRGSYGREEYRHAYEAALKRVIDDDLIKPTGGTKRAPDGYRKLTQAEIHAGQVGFARTLEIEKRGALLVAESLLNGAAVPIGSPGHAPSPAVGGLTAPTLQQILSTPKPPTSSH